MPTAARILWRSAGSPLRPGVEVAPSACWWCGLWSEQTASTDLVSDTFPTRQNARAPRSTRLCAACAWTLCEQVALPKAQGIARIATLAERGNRAQVSLYDAPPRRYLILRLNNGLVGMWQAQDSAKKEEAWKEAIAELRVNPQTVGEIPYLGAVPLDALAPDATEKFRSYHHFGGDNLPWEVATDSHKTRIREILLSPPHGPYVAVIGDGQKHGVIYAEPGFGPVDCAVYFLTSGRTLRYDPAHLARLLTAVEQLVVAGADDAHILTGRYQRPTLPLLTAMPLAEPVVAPHRGSPLLDLCLYLRRPRPILQEDTALVESLCPPTPSVRPDPTPPDRPVEPAGNDLNQPASGRPAEPPEALARPLPARGDPQPDDALDRSERPPEPHGPRQLSLFGS